jgi:hypothetical protein
VDARPEVERFRRLARLPGEQQSLTDPTDQAIEEELAEVGLLAYLE